MSRPIRITEVGSMGTCEKMWQYRYSLGREDPPSGAMTKGTLIHAIYAVWWKRGAVDTEITEDYLVEITEELGDEKGDEVAHMNEQDRDDAFWLMNRYAQVYADAEFPPFEQVHSELEWEAEIDGLTLQGKADGIVLHKQSGRLFLQECKSMRDWRRLDILTVDPQMTHYYLGLRAAGYEVDGVLYDAIKTYRWKRDDHPPEDSVQRVFIDRTPEQCEASLVDLHAFDDRREDIESGRRSPLRNISSFGSCSFCNFRAECWEELAFPEPEITWEGE